MALIGGADQLAGCLMDSMGILDTVSGGESLENGEVVQNGECGCCLRGWRLYG